MDRDEAVRRAQALGRAQAERLEVQRAEVLRRREEVTRRAAAARTGARTPAPALRDAVGRTPPVGLLVAEGDSWFDYPFHDVLSLLEDAYGYDVRSVAHRGDRVEDMAFGGRREHPDDPGAQLVELTRLLEKLLREGHVPHAILLSGGGNDVAGGVFEMLLEHKHSPEPGLNPGVVEGVVDRRLRLAYATLLAAVTRTCELRTGAPVPILVHGYDYPVPDGRGYLGGWGPLPGPWLDPGFRQKGYEALGERAGLVRGLIDRFNAMLAQLPALPGFGHVRHVDLRGTLAVPDVPYERLWENELHPTRAGFERVCAKLAGVLAEVA